MKRSSERAGDESANGEDRRESDHSEAMQTSEYSRGRGIYQGENGESCCRTWSIFMLILARQPSQDSERSNVGKPETFRESEVRGNRSGPVLNISK